MTSCTPGRLRHRRAVAGCRCAHRHQGQLLGANCSWNTGCALVVASPAVAVSPRVGASPAWPAPAQRQLGEQGRHFVGVAFVHLAGVVQARLDQPLANGVHHLVNHLAVRTASPSTQAPQAIEVAHLARPDTMAPRVAASAFQLERHAQHVGCVAGGEAAVDGQALALEPGDGGARARGAPGWRAPGPRGLGPGCSRPTARRRSGAPAWRHRRAGAGRSGSGWRVVTRFAGCAARQAPAGARAPTGSAAPRGGGPMARPSPPEKRTSLSPPRANGVDLDGFHHRTPSADQCTIKTQGGLAVAH